MGLRSKAELTEAIRRRGRAVLVVNARSRRGRRYFRRSCDLLRRDFDVIDAHEVRRPELLTETLERAMKAGPDLVVVGGGDGTLSTAGRMLAHQDAALGVLPLGTTNNFARSLDVPVDLEHAVRRLSTGKVADIDLGIAGDRMFVNLASFGMSTEVARRVRPGLKRVLGRAAYPLTALRLLPRHRPFQARIVADGVEHEMLTHQLNIASGRFHGGWQIARDISIDDRRLVAYRLGSGRRIWLLRDVLVQSLRGRRRPVDAHPFLTAPEMWLDTDPPMAVDVDGEIGAETPLRVRCLPNALRVVVSPAFRDV